MSEKKYNVDSFNLDHTKVVAPFVRLSAVKTGKNGDKVSKFDIRFCQPNKDFMSTGELHTLEHLVAEYIRDELPASVIDFSPMGCRTGFYFTVWDEHTENEIAQVFLRVLKKVAVWQGEIPAATEKECGNFRDHNLEGAKVRAAQWVSGIEKKGFTAFV